MQFAFANANGHWIHGSGTNTVTHNRAIGTYNGKVGYMVVVEADTAYTITGKTPLKFVINCAGNWEAIMILRTPRESTGT